VSIATHPVSEIFPVSFAERVDSRVAVFRACLSILIAVPIIKTRLLWHVFSPQLDLNGAGCAALWGAVN